MNAEKYKLQLSYCDCSTDKTIIKLTKIKELQLMPSVPEHAKIELSKDKDLFGISPIPFQSVWAHIPES